MDILLNFTELASEVNQVRDRLKELEAERDSLVAAHMKLEGELRQAKNNLHVLQKKADSPHALDYLDEEWLWKNQATVEFRVRLNGERHIRLSTIPGKRPLLGQTTKDGYILKNAVRRASGRTGD